MATAKDSLRNATDQLSEDDAREVLELVRTKTASTSAPRKPKALTREELIKRAASQPGIHPPDPNAPPFRKVEPIECPGIPASELLIRDRR
jgi:hypothetical protein